MQKSPRKLSNSSVQALPENRRHLMDLDEGELFMELIRDVANELDIDVLCHKILVNVGLLTHADRGSLFLAKGTPTNRYLVAKLFDVTQKTGELSPCKCECKCCPFSISISICSHCPICCQATVESNGTKQIQNTHSRGQPLLGRATKSSNLIKCALPSLPTQGEQYNSLGK